MNSYEMVIIIVAIVMIASIFKARYRAMSGVDGEGNEDEAGDRRSRRRALSVSIRNDPETGRLRDEMKALKDRIAVLERLVTETNGSVALDREIERLR